MWFFTLYTVEDMTKVQEGLKEWSPRPFDHKRRVNRINGHTVKLTGIPMHLTDKQLRQIFPDAVAVHRFPSPIWPGAVSDSIRLTIPGPAPTQLASTKVCVEEGAVEPSIVAVDNKPVCFGCRQIGHTRNHCLTAPKTMQGNANEGRRNLHPEGKPTEA